MATKYTKLPGYFMLIFSLIESIFDCFASPSLLVTVNDFDRWILFFIFVFITKQKHICQDDAL